MQNEGAQPPLKKLSSFHVLCHYVPLHKGSCFFYLSTVNMTGVLERFNRSYREELSLSEIISGVMGSLGNCNTLRLLGGLVSF